MIRDNILPMTAYLAPPSSPDEATQRVAELAADTLMGLTGSIFKDVAQFTHAMSECRMNCRLDVQMDNGRVKTYKGTIIDSGGYEYKIIVNAVGEYYLQVINVKLVKPGPNCEPAALKAINEVLKDEPAETVERTPQEGPAE